MTTDNLNLNALTHEALSAIFFADMKLVGTPAYIGLGFYWSMEYKHTLRDASVSARRKVHNALLKAGLAVDGASPAHAAIVARFTR